MSTQSIKGFADLFAPQSQMYTFMEEKARHIFGLFGYTELRTPIMEYTDLFCRSIGTETDVVQKEMYTFPDRKGRSLTLRPEATAGVMRAYIQAGRHSLEPVSKLFSYGPMFRYERPQKGRMRQFHQLNCECLGAKGPQTDAEMIVMVSTFLQSIGIENTELHINSLGCATCRPQYRQALYTYLKELDDEALCEDCRRRMEANPLRVLDCKVPTCREHTEKAPRIREHICSECGEHFAAVLLLLNASHIPYVLDDRLVRGLDYYCRTTFEIVSNAIGAQASIAGGGRYDGLVKQLGGQDVAGVGFACGMERLAMLLPECTPQRPTFHIVSMEKEGKLIAFNLALLLRKAEFCGDICHSEGGFKSQMRQAGKSNAHFALILGEEECAAATVTVKHMDTGTQECISQTQLVEYIQARQNV